MNLLSVRFKLRTSISLGIIFILIQIGGALCVYFIAVIPWWAKITLTACILMNLIIIMDVYVLLNNDNAIVEFWLDGEGAWHLRKNSGELALAFISYPVFVSNYLIVINFILKNRKKRVSLPIFRDGLLDDDFRKLKMILKTCRS